MSTTPYFTQSETILIKDNPGTLLKSLVADLVSMDAALSIHSVLKDTTSEYSAVIRIYDSPVYIQIHNSSSWIYILEGYFDSSGTFVSPNSAYRPDMLKSGSGACCFSWGLGDAIRFCCISSSDFSGQAVCFAYSKITANANRDSTVFAFITTAYSTGFPVAPIVNFSAPYTYNNDTNTLEAVVINGVSPDNASLRSGYDYTLQPTGYSASTATKGYLNIRWGGSHQLYRLYNNASAVTITPGKTVSINGVSTMSVGMVLHAE